MSGLAVCMVDKEPRIRDAAKVFFHKYSEVRFVHYVSEVLPSFLAFGVVRRVTVTSSSVHRCSRVLPLVLGSPSRVLHTVHSL